MKSRARIRCAKVLIVPIALTLIGCNPSCEGIAGVAMTTMQSVVPKSVPTTKDSDKAKVEKQEKPPEWKESVPVLRGKFQPKKIREPGQGVQ